jgi:hypothetical protein
MPLYVCLVCVCMPLSVCLCLYASVCMQAAEDVARELAGRISNVKCLLLLACVLTCCVHIFMFDLLTFLVALGSYDCLRVQTGQFRGEGPTGSNTYLKHYISCLPISRSSTHAMGAMSFLVEQLDLSLCTFPFVSLEPVDLKVAEEQFSCRTVLVDPPRAGLGYAMCARAWWGRVG